MVDLLLSPLPDISKEASVLDQTHCDFLMRRADKNRRRPDRMAAAKEMGWLEGGCPVGQCFVSPLMLVSITEPARFGLGKQFEPESLRSLGAGRCNLLQP